MVQPASLRPAQSLSDRALLLHIRLLGEDACWLLFPTYYLAAVFGLVLAAAYAALIFARD